MENMKLIKICVVKVYGKMDKEVNKGIEIDREEKGV